MFGRGKRLSIGLFGRGKFSCASSLPYETPPVTPPSEGLPENTLCLRDLVSAITARNGDYLIMRV